MDLAGKTGQSGRQINFPGFQLVHRTKLRKACLWNNQAAATTTRFITTTFPPWRRQRQWLPPPTDVTRAATLRSPCPQQTEGCWPRSYKGWKPNWRGPSQTRQEREKGYHSRGFSGKHTLDSNANSMKTKYMVCLFKRPLIQHSFSHSSLGHSSSGSKSSDPQSRGSPSSPLLPSNWPQSREFFPDDVNKTIKGLFYSAPNLIQYI